MKENQGGKRGTSVTEKNKLHEKSKLKHFIKSGTEVPLFPPRFL